MKILINSYACCPDMGSEPGMGWNWIIHLAKYCEVFVISEGEFRQQCEEASKGMPIHWYWNPVPQSTRDKCWNQGDWRFYVDYWRWQKHTAQIANQICGEQKIDILYQLNMIGFREPGNLWEVSRKYDIPLAWGPIGGLKQFPMSYASGWKMRAVQGFKNMMNILQLVCYPRVRRMLKQSSLLISSIPDSYRAIRRWTGRDSIVIPETGCFLTEECRIKNTERYSSLQNISSGNKVGAESASRFQSDKLNIMWAGKFDFRKRLDIAIRTIAVLKDKNVVLKVFGSGSEGQQKEVQGLIRALNLTEQVLLMGNRPHDVIVREMQMADLFFFTSVSEDTSTVVLEAVSNSLPVLCFDACGMSAVIDESVGIKVPLTNPSHSVLDFAEKISYLYDHPEELRRMSANCPRRAAELSWDNKAKQVMGLLEKIAK